MNQRQPLLIVGASARSAAESAWLAGLQPYAVDLFADADLLDIAEHVEVLAREDYPHRLPALCALFPPMPFMYVGGLENYPEIVDQIAATRTLWGNCGASLRKVRDLSVLQEIAASVGLPVPPMLSELPADEVAERWLVKQRGSCGGLHVRQATPSLNRLSADQYLQQRIEGVDYSAAFVATQNSARLLAVTQQLIGRKFGAPLPYQYAGSVGPVAITAKLQAQLTALGTTLTQTCNLSGLFGVDFITDCDGQSWSLEVNPRYTAGMEVLEISGTSPSLVALHCQAVSGETLSFPPVSTNSHVAGKRILYAPSRGQLPRDWQQRLEYDASVTWADVPNTHGPFAAGEPVITVRCVRPSACDLLVTLENAAQSLLQLWHPLID